MTTEKQPAEDDEGKQPSRKKPAAKSGWTRSTIGRHIQLALKRLKEEMEVLSHE